VTKKVFISRNPSDCEAIQPFLPDDIAIVAQSLIETTPIPFDRNIPPSDWIFFSSSNAARHFFDQKPIIANQKMGAIGNATAKTVAHYKPVDFVGDAIDITDSAYRFAQAIGSDKVLLPGAAESLKHIQSALPAEQIIDLPVYSTKEKESAVPSCDAYVFSSPSNVRSFFRNRKTHDSETLKCIAFGEATLEELKNQGVLKAEIPTSLEPRSIANTIIQMLRG
jgi:uroporphyrinogen-III synthase